MLDTLDFLEPNLAFTRISSPPDAPLVRVIFRLEARPPWRPSRHGDEDDWDDVYLEFDVTPDDLRVAARDLRADLERFPVRLMLSDGV